MRRRAAAAALLAAVATCLPATPAAAHAELLRTVPSDGAVLAAPPREVVLTFSEPVGTALGGVTVTAPDGGRVPAPVTTRDRRREVVATLPATLPEGTFLVTWRVVSQDSHPVAGATTFSVGRVTPVAAAPAAGRSDVVSRLTTAARLVSFAGLVLLVGAALFVAALWPGGRALPGTRRLLTTGWALAAAGTASALLLHGPYAAGAPLGDVADLGLLRTVLGTPFGLATAARLVLLGVVAVALIRAPGRPAVLAAGLAGAGILVTTALTGHAAAGALVALAVPLDAVHLAAATAWAGGLVTLGVLLLRHERVADLAAVLPRWSRYAALAVVVLVATGVFAAWREVREPGALTATPYGRLLLTKTAVVAAMLALAAYGRRWVRRHAGAAEPPVVRTLRRSVLLEAGGAVAVLAVTSSLVGTTPARNTYAPLFRETVEVTAALRVTVEIAPARAGVNHLRLDYASPDGRPVDVPEVTLRLTTRHADGVIPVRPGRTARGRYEEHHLVLHQRGEWRLDVVTRTTDIDAHTTRLSFRIR